MEADAPPAGLRHRRAFVDGTSDRLFANGVTLPSGSSLTDGEVERVIAACAARSGPPRETHRGGTSSAVLILVLAPMLAVIAVATRFALGRPVLFRQERCGRHGAVFAIWKFRTMREPHYPGEPDAARTPALGRLLRASSLDELPQLWNILRGQMSVIGPRPTLPEQVARYSDRERGRLAVRPGLTGWAQVHGRNAIDWRERIELDLWWVENRSVAVDTRILCRTVAMVLTRRGVVGAGGVNPGFPGPRAAPAEELVTGPFRVEAERD